MILATILSERYPGDYAPYFEFLDRCRSTEKDRAQRHHILPRKQFPEYEHLEENLIPLSVLEHLHAHRLLEACSSGKIRNPGRWLDSREAAVRGGQATKGRPRSEDTKRKISEARRATKGRPLSEEHRRKLSAALKGRPLSEEHRRQLSIANRGNPKCGVAGARGGRANKGRPLSEECKRKISESVRRTLARLKSL